MYPQQISRFNIWLMWSLASFFYAYQYILRVLPNIMMTDILEKFHIDATIFGQYSGLYYIGYAGMHIPVGILLDKYGPQRVLPFCMMLTVIGVLPLLYAEHWIYPSLGRMLIGMGSSAAILGVFKIIRMFFPEDKFAFILGWSVTIGLIGAIYGGRPVNYLIQTYGAAPVLQVVILVGLLLAITTFIATPKQSASSYDKTWQESVKEVLTNPTILIVCVLAGLMVGPLEGFADVWGKAYLKSVYHLSDSHAAHLPSLMFLGMCFGGPMLSWFAEKSKAYFSFIILSGAVMGGAFMFLLSGQVPENVLSILFFVVGIFCAYQILAIYKASTYSGEKLVGLTTACANMIIMAFGYLFHSVIGKIITMSWDGTMAGNLPVYNATSYTYGVMIIPIGLLLGALGFSCVALFNKRAALQC